MKPDLLLSLYIGGLRSVMLMHNQILQYEGDATFVRKRR